MAGSRARDASRSRRESIHNEDDSILGSALASRQLEAFGRKVTTTANHLMGDGSNSVHYNHAMSNIHKQLRHPGLQRSLFSFTQTSPTDLVRSKLSTSEISHRAVAYIPDELLINIPEESSTYSLFQGFQATLPETENEHRKGHRRRASKPYKTLEGVSVLEDGPPSLKKLKKERDALNHRLEMMGIRKNMCSTEIHEIDNKIANLNNMRKIVLDRLADIELDEAQLEHDLLELENQVEELQEFEDERAIEESTGTITEGQATPETQAMDASFMSESIYEKLPSPSVKKKPHKITRRKSMPVLHEHLEAGSNLKIIPAHNDSITALDFDIPFGTMVTAALDDTVRVWDLNSGRCMGFLEGHTASVRCLQVEDNFVATGSMDASIRLWDLSRAKYDAFDIDEEGGDEDEEEGLRYGNEEDESRPPPTTNAMGDCPIFTLESHVDEITALHLRGDTLVSGSADKTLRQWDLVKGRCVQTLDVLWAAAQASATVNPAETQWRPMGRTHDANADFVGALQSFEAALACGTADGMVRLWDLRSGQVHRSLVGHTGPVTCLQFDDAHLVTGSADRSIRIWDLRTGSIFDAYAYDSPIVSMMFDNRRIVSAVGEDVVKVYDKTEGRHWDCGAGADNYIDDSDIVGTKSPVERVRIKDGYMIEGRKNGVVGVWSC